LGRPGKLLSMPAWGGKGVCVKYAVVFRLEKGLVMEGNGEGGEEGQGNGGIKT